MARKSPTVRLAEIKIRAKQLTEKAKMLQAKENHRRHTEELRALNPQRKKEE